MKKIIRITCATLACIYLSSCSDNFLDVNAPSISEESFFTTERQATLALTGAYDILGWDDTSYFPFWLGDILGHDAYKGGEGPGDQPWIEDYVARMMHDRRFVDETYQRLKTDKMFRWVESQISPVDKTISAEEFNAMQAEHQHTHADEAGVEGHDHGDHEGHDHEGHEHHAH